MVISLMKKFVALFFGVGGAFKLSVENQYLPLILFLEKNLTYGI